MRFPLMIAAGLMATACNAPAEDERSPQTEADMAQNDADGAFASEPPAGPEFAATAAMSDMYEINASKVALEQAESPKVREFAQMMINDHTKSSEALKAAVSASGQTMTMPAQLDAEHQARVASLRDRTGEGFDREYMSQQLAAHGKTLAMLKAYGASGDVAELRQFAQATIPTVQMHLEWLDNNWPMPGATGGTPGATLDATPAP